MTSKAKIEANRRNALKSTGPRTKFGKFRSSKNAFKHGLTANPDPHQTLMVFQEIIDQPNADPFMELPDRNAIRAMSLAASQLRLSAAHQNEREFLVEYKRFFENQFFDDGLIESLMAGNIFDTKFSKREAKEILQISGMGFNGGAYAAAREFYLARRYLREAEAAHTKALKTWCQSDDIVSRNEPK